MTILTKHLFNSKYLKKSIVTILIFTTVLLVFIMCRARARIYDTRNIRELNLKDISCYKTPDSVLRQADRNFTPSNNSIFFLETSCKGGLNSRQACAVESAARAHPRRRVAVLVTGPLDDEFMKGNTFINLITKYNIEFIRIQVTDFAKGTPPENLFLKNVFKKSSYPIEHCSDVLRILTLYKYGGLYLDLDVIVLKSFNFLPANFVAKESLKMTSAGVLAFSTEGIGKKFSEAALRDLAARYKPNTWSGNGPALILRTLKKICSVKGLAKMSNQTCNGFHVMDTKLFYPISYQSRKKYFEDRQPEPTKAYMHHMWNKFTFNTIVPKSSLYARLAQKYCPEVYKLYGKNFGS